MWPEESVSMAMAVILILTSIISPIANGYEELENFEDKLNVEDGDNYGPIEYTDNHTTVEIGPSDRSTTLTMPGGHVYGRPLPLVIALHGYSSSGYVNAWWMGLYNSVHENEHLLMTPDGTIDWFGLRYWNATDACCNLFDTAVDDVAFIESLIDEAVANYGADPRGVVLIGHSNGGFMSHRMACDKGNMIESIISLNGATWDNFDNKCPDTGRPNILHIHSTLDNVIQYDGGILNGAQYPSAQQTTSSWAARSGCDENWTNTRSIDLTYSFGFETDSLEHLNCSDENRVAHWRINNGSHNPYLNSPGWANNTLEWALEDFIRDSDGDGYRDDVDDFIYNPNEWLDTDGDGVGDNADIFPNDSTEWLDTDGDGIGDNSDTFSEDALEWSDTDGDGIGDNADAFSEDALEWSDTDGDGVGDNADYFPLDPDKWKDNRSILFVLFLILSILILSIRKKLI